MTEVIKEASRLIESGLSSEVAKYNDESALSERISEWLDTPTGTVPDKPSWGHNLNGFKFDPLNQNLAVAMELAVTEKILQDIEDLIFLGVRVVINDIDYCTIIIRHQFGDTISQKKLE